MSEVRTAVVNMEEGYMNLTIKYDDLDYKSEICQAIIKLEKKMNIYPEVIHRRDSSKKAFCLVEFSGDDYVCSRSCGDFIEEMIVSLDIKECVTD